MPSHTALEEVRLAEEKKFAKTIDVRPCEG